MSKEAGMYKMKMITDINIKSYKYWYKQMDDNCYTTFSQKTTKSMKAYEHLESRRILVNMAIIIELVMATEHTNDNYSRT